MSKQNNTRRKKRNLRSATFTRVRHVVLWLPSRYGRTALWDGLKLLSLGVVLVRFFCSPSNKPAGDGERMQMLSRDKTS